MAGDDPAELRRLVDGLRGELAGIRRDLGRAAAGADVARLRDEVRLLGRRAKALDELAGLRKDAHDLDDRVTALDARLAEQDRAADDRAARFAAEVEQLVRRVTRLEGGARSGPARRSAPDLDDPGADTRELAALAGRGAALAAELLTDEQRRARHAEVKDGDRGVAARDRAVEDLVAASLVIARSEPGAPGRPAAVRDFTAARAALADHRGVHDQVARTANRARHALETDRRRTADHRVAIEAGRAADAELARRGRARLAETAERGELPPAWLDDALGAAPPAPERGRWLDAGADLLAYRWTYGVTGAPALGDPPDAADPARLARYRALTERLRRGR